MSLLEESERLRIPFGDIREATKNFTTLIGKGGYGLVYKGHLLLSGKLTPVAVKRLQVNLSGQGFKEFLTEIQLLTRYKHPNLISLIGFCYEGEEKILIYEYAEHGSLDKYLSTVEKRRALTWKRRLNICVNAARGLNYLHNQVAVNERVIHRDIKSANVLLDQDWKAMISDFGLSKLGRANEKDTYLITNASGTYGYCDPIYTRSGILTKESDVYSFGVVLFEVLCGRLCVIDVHNEHRFLPQLAQSYYKKGKINEIMDPELQNQLDSDSLKTFSEIAFKCIKSTRKQRPSMRWVLKKLQDNLVESSSKPSISSGPALNVAPLLSGTMNNEVQVGGVTFEAISGSIRQNNQILDQISANMSSTKLQDNIKLFSHTKNNIAAILNKMRYMPFSSLMPPLPVSLNEDLATSIETAVMQDDIEHFGDVGPLDDNVESFLQHDAGDCSTLKQTITEHKTGSSKGFSFGEVGCIWTTNKVTCCHFSSDGKLLGSAGHEKKPVLWNMDTLQTWSTPEEHQHVITDIRFRPNSTQLATASFDKSVRIWDAANPSNCLHAHTGHTGHIMSLDFHSKKNDLFCFCDSNNEIQYWNLSLFQCTRISKQGGSAQVRFQPVTGHLLAAASDKVVSIFDVENDRQTHSFEAHSDVVNYVCWDSNGDYLASVTEESVKV
uniref:putative receptor-like protein kinase At5g39000 n=1 Tax=Erigeron canadensis TaxID=72917 RepID=UPI001CB964EB|nr:putative receptor-like protein kinase At5g39000 [Erigeron canadensis]